MIGAKMIQWFWHVALFFVPGYCCRHLKPKTYIGSMAGGWWECGECEQRKAEHAQRSLRRSERFKEYLDGLREEMQDRF